MSEDRLSTDGGLESSVTDIERAGATPPETPTEDGLDRLLPDLLDGIDGVERAYLVRIRFGQGDPRSTAKRLVDALERQVDVLGDTSDAGFDPTSPVLDALVETDYGSGAIARSLAQLGPVEGVLTADVTDAAEAALGDDTDDADTAGANDVFQELKEQVNQLGYGDVVDELEDVSFPGGPDPDEEIDLEAETGIDLQDEGTGTAAPGGSNETADGGTLDLDGDDADGELDIRGLLKGDDEEDAGDEGPVGGADEESVSEAIREIELDTGTDDDDAGEAGTANPETAGNGSSPDVEDDALDGIPAPKQPSRKSSTRATNDSDDSSSDSEDASGNAESTTAESTTTGSNGHTRDDTDGITGSIEADEMDAFVAALIEALESGAIDGDRRAQLRRALDVGNTHSLDVRVEYLQKRVDNLAAYTDAWEAFLSEEGAGREFIDDVSDDLSDLEARVEAIEETLESIDHR